LGYKFTEDDSFLASSVDTVLIKGKEKKRKISIGDEEECRIHFPSAISLSLLKTFMNKCT
jgi:hypothetical protein